MDGRLAGQEYLRRPGDDTAYRDYRDRYRELATSLGYQGHLKWAETMP
jgi:adenylate cyclase